MAGNQNKHNDERHFRRLERLLIKQHEVARKHYEVILKTIKTMSKELDDLNAKLDRQDAAIAGITTDITWLKAKVDANPGGLSAAEVAQISTRLDASAAKLEALDSETDSTQA